MKWNSPKDSVPQFRAEGGGGGKREGAEGKIVQEVQYIFQPAKAHVK